MVTKIQEWGNSQGIRFSKEILRKVHVSVGDEVDVEIRHGVIVVKPVAPTRGKYKLKNLVAEIPVKYHPREEGWGNPKGKEVW